MANSVENKDFIPPPDPWALFQEWYELAKQSEPNDPDAMSLATVGKDGMPSVRMVLMKHFDKKGLVFFTNRHSRKGEQLDLKPKAAICLHWKSLHRQIRVEGEINQVSSEESDTYHASRPRGSQIGAWASDQSHILKDRKALEQKAAALEAQYEGKPIPRPPHWGGYRITPLLIEFWQERPYRLHDRIVYRRYSDKEDWIQERLYP